MKSKNSKEITKTIIINKLLSIYSSKLSAKAYYKKKL